MEKGRNKLENITLRVDSFKIGTNHGGTTLF